MGQLEHNLENHKQAMVIECPEYNTIDAFRLMDEQGQGVVSAQFINEFISANFQHIEYSAKQLDLFMKRFDKNERNQIKYSQFCSAFAPINESCKQMLGQRDPFNTDLERQYQETF